MHADYISCIPHLSQEVADEEGMEKTTTPNVDVPANTGETSEIKELVINGDYTVYGTWHIEIMHPDYSLEEIADLIRDGYIQLDPAEKRLLVDDSDSAFDLPR